MDSMTYYVEFKGRKNVAWRMHDCYSSFGIALSEADDVAKQENYVRIRQKVISDSVIIAFPTKEETK